MTENKQIKTKQRERRGPVYLLRLQGKPGDSVHGLRAVLKTLLRRHGLRCVDAREEQTS